MKRCQRGALLARYPYQRCHLSALSASVLLKVLPFHPPSFNLARHDSGALVPVFPRRGERSVGGWMIDAGGPVGGGAEWSGERAAPRDDRGGV